MSSYTLWTHSLSQRNGDRDLRLIELVRLLARLAAQDAYEEWAKGHRTARS